MCVCVCCIYVYSISSLYLLVFGDDHIQDIREQRMLQVDLVRHRDEVGASWEIL